MARIEPAVDYSTILRMKGVLDYSTWRGVNYVRSWPRKSRHARGPGELAGSNRFKLATQDWRNQLPTVQDFYKTLVRGTTERSLDLWTASFTKLSGLWNFGGSPVPRFTLDYVPHVTSFNAGILPGSGDTFMDIGLEPIPDTWYWRFVAFQPKLSRFSRVYRGRLCSGISLITEPPSSFGLTHGTPPLTHGQWPTNGPLGLISVEVLVGRIIPLIGLALANAPVYFFTFTGDTRIEQTNIGHIGDWTFP